MLKKIFKKVILIMKNSLKVIKNVMSEMSKIIMFVNKENQVFNL